METSLDPSAQTARGKADVPNEAPRSAPPFVVGLLLFSASVLLCLLAYLAFSVPGPWFSRASPIHWTAREFGVPHGTAKIGREGLALVVPDATGTTLASINTSFRSRDYPLVAWDVSDVPDGVAAAMLWSNEYEPAKVFSLPLAIESGRIAPAMLGSDPHWLGRVTGLALILRGTFTTPILLRGVVAKPMTAGEVLRNRVAEWLEFEPWNGASINTRTGGADRQDLPLPPLLAVVVGLAAVAYFAFARRWGGGFHPAIAAGLFIAAWFILDAVWQWNLVRQVVVTFEQYGGKSWHERHLAAEDNVLFAFVDKARAKMPPPPARVFIAADVQYFRYRAAYHLYPYNVYFDPAQNTVPPATAMRSGDYLMVFQRKGVQYDAARHLLSWDGGSPVPADLVLLDAGSALLRIR